MLLGTDPTPLVRREGDPQRYRWACTVCGYDGNWSDGFESYGSHLLDGNAALLFLVCSEECKKSDHGKALLRIAKKLKIHVNPWSGAITGASWRRIDTARNAAEALAA